MLIVFDVYGAFFFLSFHADSSAYILFFYLFIVNLLVTYIYYVLYCKQLM